MRKSFVQNIVFLVLLNLVVKPFWILGIDRTVQNTVGHEVFGLYQALLNTTIIFQIILDFGLQAYNSKVITKSPEAMRNLFPNIFAVKLIFAFIYIIIVLSFGMIIGYDNQVFGLLSILMLMQIALSFLLFFRSNIAAFQRFKMDAMFSVADRIIGIAILAILLFGAFAQKNMFKIEWYALTQLFAYGIVAIIAFWTCSKITEINWKHIRFNKIKVVIRQSLPYALLIFMMAIYMRVDAILIEKISLDPSLAGKYAAAYRLLDVSNNMSGVLIAGMLLPLFGKQLAQKENYHSIVQLCTQILFSFGATIAVICFFWNMDILQLMQYKNINSTDGQTLFWLMLSFPFYCLYYVYSTLLTANGNIKTLIGISAIALCLNLVLNLSLLSPSNPENGLIAARNTFVTITLVCISDIYFCRKYLQVHFSLKTVLQWIVFVVFIVLFGYLIEHYYASIPIFHKFSFTIITAIVLVLSIGIVPVRAIVAQIKKYKSGI